VVASTTSMPIFKQKTATLRKAADRIRKDVSIEKLPENQREIVAAFARRLDKVPPDLMAELKKIVLKSSDNEQPFHRTGRGIVVPPISTQNLRKFAEKVRSVFAEDDLIEFPIMDVLEFRLGTVFEGFYIDISEKESVGEDEGRVIGGTKGLALREDVYEGAWGGRDRFPPATSSVISSCTEPLQWHEHAKIPTRFFRDAECGHVSRHAVDVASSLGGSSVIPMMRPGNAA
jgi:hypothetical protein